VNPRALIDVVVPAYNAQSTVAAVVAALPQRELRSIVVVDRASSDRTSEVARDAGAITLRSERGYGAACLRALEHFGNLPQPPDIVVFIPGSDLQAAAEAPLLYAPIRDRAVEICLGVRARSPWSERVVSGLIEAVYRQRVGGLGSVRAIRYAALVALDERSRRRLGRRDDGACRQARPVLRKRRDLRRCAITKAFGAGIVSYRPPLDDEMILWCR
jgi:glycosyltransferase involved in cell wall biosynthesis